MFNKELMLPLAGHGSISALSFETMAYREIIWHPDVVERVPAAFAQVRSKS